MIDQENLKENEVLTSHEKNEKISNTFVSATIVILLLFNLFCTLVIVNGNSMYPTLKNGEVGFQLRHWNQKIERFDIVSIDLDADSEKTLYVKRIIGLPNETLEYINGQLYINGNLIVENYISIDYKMPDFKIKLSDDEYWVLGDNRGNSKDSRSFGPIKIKEITGYKIKILF